MTSIDAMRSPSSSLWRMTPWPALAFLLEIWLAFVLMVMPCSDTPTSSSLSSAATRATTSYPFLKLRTPRPFLPWRWYAEDLFLFALPSAEIVKISLSVARTAPTTSSSSPSSSERRIAWTPAVARPIVRTSSSPMEKRIAMP